MIVLLAFLPLQAWAGIGTSAASIGMVQAHQAPDAADVTQAPLAMATDAFDPSTHESAPAAQESSYPADNAEPSPPGADFAEQLLPAPFPRMATATGRSAVPQYALTAFPAPDLPLPPPPPPG